MLTKKVRLTGSIVTGFAMLSMPLEASAAGSVWAFGDSLADNGNIAHIIPGFSYGPGYDGARFSNGPVYVEYLPALIHQAFIASNDKAVGGAYAGTGNLVGAFLPGTATEIATFASAGGRFAPQDTVLLSAGPNDYFGIVRDAGSGPIDQTAETMRVLGDIKADATSLIGLGARRLVVLNVPNLGLTPSYQGDAAATALAAANNAALPGVLTPLSGHGTNIYVVDLQRLLNEAIADPSRFGLTDVVHACALTPACLAASPAVQDQTLFWDGVHPNTAVHAAIARVIANELGAVDAIGAQAQLTLADAESFTDRLIARLQLRDPPAAGAGGGPVSFFLQADQVSGHFDGQGGQDDFGDDIVATTAGAQVGIGQHALAGLAIGYSRASAGASDLDGMRDAVGLRYDAYHIGLYGQLEKAGAFVDVAGSYVVYRDPKSSRPGLFPGEQLTGAPDAQGGTVTAAIGYRLRRGPFRVGPVARLGYAHVDLDSYTEQGEPVLTQQVGSQGVDSLIGRAGLEADAAIDLKPGRLQPHLALDVAREFLDGSRTLSTSFTSIGIPLATRLPGYGGTYGIGGVGVSLALAHGGLVDLGVESSFGRRDVEQRAITLSGRISF